MEIETETNLLGISENLADSIAEEQALDEKQFEKLPLHGKKIAISVSESEELEQLGVSEHHVKDISIEIARYLIANGAILLYGGDLRRNGFTELFSEISYQYKEMKDRKFRFVNYFPFPNSRDIDLEAKANFKVKQVEPVIVEIPTKLGNIDRGKSYKPFENIEDRFIFAECLTDMRIKMAADSDARIILGGRQTNYLGYMPGILEETYHSLKSGKPTYIVGGFGGAAKSAIAVINGKFPQEITNGFQYNSEFLNDFKSYSQKKSSISLDYDEMIEFLQQYRVERISELNGLTIEENEVLFESTNIHELVFLMIKGLKQKIGNS